MTVDAGLGGRLVAFPGMAAFAFDLLVGPLQRKVGLVVIEARPGPGLRDVAIGANLTETAFVRIVFLVTADTLIWRLAMLLVRGMATFAGHLGMGTFQQKIRELVIEGIRVQADDVFASTLVIRVTVLALRILNIRTETMKPFPGFYIQSDVFVAIKAEADL